jgi:hypothetical protein
VPQTLLQSKDTNFLQELQRFSRYTQDFLDLAKSDEYEPSSDLAMVSTQAGDYASSATTLLEVYEDVSCEQDRLAVRKVIQRDFAYYGKQTNGLLKQVTLGIGYTKKPGVAAEAVRMRDDLIELQSLFDSPKLR